jgi:hypothetical protein
MACNEEDESMVACLVAAGANIHCTDECGQMPLHIAVEIDDFDLAKQLVAAGARATDENKSGDTPLMLARNAGWYGDYACGYMVELLEAAAKVDWRSRTSSATPKKIARFNKSNKKESSIM